jgi:hypothetical protein
MRAENQTPVGGRCRFWQVRVTVDLNGRTTYILFELTSSSHRLTKHDKFCTQSIALCDKFSAVSRVTGPKFSTTSISGKKHV